MNLAYWMVSRTTLDTPAKSFWSATRATQSTVSPCLSFAGIARACGYRQADEGLSLSDLDSFLRATNGPSLLHLKTRRGVPEGLPRPDAGPREVKQRLMRHLGVDTPWAPL